MPKGVEKGEQNPNLVYSQSTLQLITIIFTYNW